MPKLLTFLVHHAVIGFGMAVCMVNAMVQFDIGGLATLAGRAQSGGLDIAILAVLLGSTFASVQMGAAIMLLPREREGRGSSPRPANNRLVLLPAPVVRRMSRQPLPGRRAG